MYSHRIIARVFAGGDTSPNAKLTTAFDVDCLCVQIASVDDSYSEILETSCGTEAIAAGDTLYTLSDVELTKREFDVVSMSTADCADVNIDKPADCYRCVVPGMHSQLAMRFCKIKETPH